MNKRLIDRSEDHQHFALRKLTIGVASVLLGTTFMVYGGQTVHAETAQNESAQATQVESKTDESSSQASDQSDANKQQAVVDTNAAKTVVAPK